MKTIKLTLLCVMCGFTSFSQTPELYKEIYNTYTSYKEDGFDQRRIKHSLVKERLGELASKELFRLQQVGTSIEGRELFLLSVGTGDTQVFLWSQMHGDESTATRALFDIFNFLKSEDFQQEKEKLFSNLTIHFLPMLNPDGAEKFQRRNALGIDVNRDALRLQSPEGKTLKRIRDSLEADYGFNLHDQSKYYNTGRTGNPATISFLAPAYDFEKSVNEVRGNAMKLIVEMNKLLQEHIPGQVGRYNDDFEPRAFGDNIQKWGTSTILIESGGYLDDPEKEEIRKLNYTMILASLFALSEGDFLENEISLYEEIPENDRMLFDLKIEGVTYELLGNEYILDIGINRQEVDDEENLSFFYRSSETDRGDLSTSYGYEEFNAEGYRVKIPLIYPQEVTMVEVERLDFNSLLKDGYAFVRVIDLPEDKNFTEYPLHLISSDFEPRKEPGATFFLEKNGKIEFAVINGFLLDLSKEETDIENALILK
ncbi:MAG TPA: M14 metallopeptidase family protein [Gillisia sp.]|nr:M14 metallopeptidase family protein [Gillisia sp.]